jgi:hypothetical protein
MLVNFTRNEIPRSCSIHHFKLFTIEAWWQVEQTPVSDHQAAQCRRPMEDQRGDQVDITSASTVKTPSPTMFCSPSPQTQIVALAEQVRTPQQYECCGVKDRRNHRQHQVRTAWPLSTLKSTNLNADKNLSTYAKGAEGDAEMLHRSI